MQKIRYFRQIIFFITTILLSSCAGLHSDPLADDDGSPNYAAKQNTNFWILLGKDLQIDHETDRPQVQAHIEWYLNHKQYLENAAKRGTPYVYFILQEVKKRHMPSEIALIPIIESGYNPFAYSPDGAAGLWQMMPSTAVGFKIRQNWWYDGRRDIFASTNAALNYLQFLYKEFNHDWLLAIAAYNAGDGTIKKAIAYNEAKGLPTDFWHLTLSQQTEDYVPSLLALATIIAHPHRYHIDWPTTQLAPYITPVEVGTQIDLAKAAECAGISVEELYLLNPGFNRWATDPEGEHILLVPTDKEAAFKENLAKLPKANRVTWAHYTVQPGDSLIKISHKFATSVSLLKDINNLKSNHLRIGQVLLIPEAKKSLGSLMLTNIKHFTDIKHYLHHEHKIAGPTRIVHNIKSGENLWVIAHHYGVTTQQIRYWNHLEANTVLKPDTDLVLWISEPAIKTIKKSPVSTAKNIGE